MAAFRPWHLLCEPYNQVWQSAIQPASDSKRKDAAVELTMQLPAAGSYVVYTTHPERKGLTGVQVQVKGNHGEVIYDKTHAHLSKASASASPTPSSSSSSSLSLLPSTPPGEVPAIFHDPFELDTVEVHNPNVPATLTVTIKKCAAPGKKAKSAAQVAVFCNELLSLPMRKLSEAELQQDKERIERELAVNSDAKMVAYAAGLIRPFLVLVSMAPPVRQHLAKRLGVSLSKDDKKNTAAAAAAAASSSDLSASVSASSSSSAALSASLSSLPQTDAPDSHREAALIVRAMSAKSFDLRSTRVKWMSSVDAAAMVAGQLDQSGGGGQATTSALHGHLQQRSGGSDSTEQRPFFDVKDTPPDEEQQAALSRGFGSIAAVFGRDCPDWYSVLDELVWTLLVRLLPPPLQVPKGLLLPEVESLQLRVVACRQPVDPLVLSSELRAMQVIESWLRSIRQEKAHRNQRPYLLQFEHVMHGILRGDELPAKLEGLHRVGVRSPSAQRLLVQVLLESWLSRVVQHQGGRDTVPRLLAKANVDELFDGLQTLLYRPRKQRTYFMAKKSGRMASLAEVGMTSVATGVSAELQSGAPGSGEGVIAGIASAAKEAVRRGAMAMVRKHENALVDVVFDVLLQEFILRSRHIWIERYVPGAAGRSDDDLLADIADSYFDAIPGVVLSSRLNASDWSEQRVLDWLDHIELPDYKPVFAAARIDGLALINIQPDQLVALGIPVGHAIRIHALVPRFVPLRH